MTDLFDTTARRGLRSVALALALAGSLGLAWGQEGAADVPQFIPRMSVDSRVQPQDTPREFLASRSQAAATEVTPLRVELGAWKEYRAASAPAGGAMQVGAQRLSTQTATVDALASQLQWSTTASGARVAAVSVRSEGAYGIRLGVEMNQLPGNALLRVYAQQNRAGAYEIAGQRILQVLQANLDAGDTGTDGRTWWTPDTGGDEVTLEIELPPGVPADTLRIAIPRVMHVHENLSLPLEGEMQFSAQLNESLPCQLDSTCYDAYSSQRNAVARMLYIKDGMGYVCSGTLLNDTASSGTPYFVTANHCISSQTVASTLETSWFYRTPSCNSRTLSSGNKVLRNGATLLYATATYDGALMRLNDTPPAGAVFSGWTTQTLTSGASVVGIHHPRGDLQKISFGTVYGSVACEPSSEGTMLCSNDSKGNGGFNLVTWNQGLTQPGSSGSGLFLQGRLAGTLYGGDDQTCSASGGTSIYGRFDLLYPALQKWLAASATTARSPVYRFYNAHTGAHFYTGSVAERDYVIAKLPEFQYENVAFYASAQPQQDLSPVFRFYNQDSGAHYYTISESVRDYVHQTFARFIYEGPTWYAQKNAVAGSVPVYQFYNLDSGAHFYTANASERDYVIATFARFRNEGIAYYVWPSQ
ncbi:putative peptidase S1 and S6 chymotrypsin/Hap [Delftia acidovorans]|uniref:trypsin-like peptidase domain-containing protein n=1 Tax=Delftia acidovorans TaxID=80866 RepID=UPI00050437D4|nr:trypsin-like peptidase domain-containing protein [Delftia acidovorans]KFJ14430.1 putative peptidase S1 and S6 chymotrypsin/Hap [Delftia acidovorans]QQB49435.1 trypsin-like peptidase domain-containing protein [Delftia acidovorans]